MTTATRSLVLGLDVSPKRLGWGLVDLVTGEPVACGMEPIDLPSMGWRHQQVARALDVVEQVSWDRRTPIRHAEIQAVYIEHPISRFPGMAYDEGQAVGIARAEVERRWPWAPIDTLKPAEWRKLAGLKGNASKPEVLRFAHRLTLSAGWNEARCDDLSGSQDAADALLIALAGQRRNLPGGHPDDAVNWQAA